MPDSTSSNTTIIGIDPGASGGMAALYPDGGIAFRSMPKVEWKVFDWLVGKDWPSLQSIRGPLKCHAYIERIGPIFGVSKTSYAKLYGSYMALRMALTCAGISYTTVPPKVWQAGIPYLTPRKKGETVSQWKGRLKLRAEQLFPQLRCTLKTSDALLIAYFGKNAPTLDKSETR